MKAGTHKTWLVFHRWAGIMTGILVVVVGAQGVRQGAADVPTAVVGIGRCPNLGCHGA